MPEPFGGRAAVFCFPECLALVGVGGRWHVLRGAPVRGRSGGSRVCRPATGRRNPGQGRGTRSADGRVMAASVMKGHFRGWRQRAAWGDAVSRWRSPTAANGAQWGVFRLLICAAALAVLPACERWTGDPRQEVRKRTGGEPLNQIVAYGSAAMPMNRVLQLPQCDVLLNGEYAYRMALDTGGGDTLLLSPGVAEEIGLATAGSTGVVGLGGISRGDLAVVDTLSLGEIRCARVFAFVASEETALVHVCDGVIGAGLLAGGRIRLDFAQAELSVAPSSDEPEEGEEVAIELGANGHILAGVQLQGKSAWALLDSGASRVVFSPRWLRENYPDHPVVELPVPQLVMGLQMATPGPLTSVEVNFAGRTMGEMVGVVLPDLDALVKGNMERRVGVVIGMTVFREMRSWTVDFPRKRMWIAWLSED